MPRPYRRPFAVIPMTIGIRRYLPWEICPHGHTANDGYDDAAFCIIFSQNSRPRLAVSSGLTSST